MKQILMLMAVVGCGKSEESPKATSNKLISDPIVEKAIRAELEKPTGELTKADLEKVTFLYLGNTKINDAGLKELAKLQQLKSLFLVSTQITEAGVAELKKALPKCDISK
jgi:hypothetical protein